LGEAGVAEFNQASAGLTLPETASPTAKPRRRSTQGRNYRGQFHNPGRIIR